MTCFNVIYAIWTIRHPDSKLIAHCISLIFILHVFFPHFYRVYHFSLNRVIAWRFFHWLNKIKSCLLLRTWASFNVNCKISWYLAMHFIIKNIKIGTFDLCWSVVQYFTKGIRRFLLFLSVSLSLSWRSRSNVFFCRIFFEANVFLLLNGWQMNADYAFTKCFDTPLKEYKRKWK